VILGLLLPCNMVVSDNGDGTSTVEATDPEAQAALRGAIDALARYNSE
jgi:uncharacterized protein (DUF302 family)